MASNNIRSNRSKKALVILPELPKYYSIWISYYTKTNNPAQLRLSEYLSELEDQDLIEFIKDAFLFEQGCQSIHSLFMRFFDQVRAGELEDLAFNSLTAISTKQLKRVTIPFEYLFSSALHHAFDEFTNRKLISKIFAFTSIVKNGLSERYIVNLIEDDELMKSRDSNFKLQLLSLLPQLEESEIANYAYWMEKKKNLNKQNAEMAPAIMLGLKKDHPKDALDVLLIYNTFNPKNIPDVVNFLYMQTRKAITNHFRLGDEQAFDDFIDLMRKIKAKWVVDLIDKILGEPNFKEIRASLGDIAPLEIPTPSENRPDAFIKLSNSLRAK